MTNLDLDKQLIELANIQYNSDIAKHPLFTYGPMFGILPGTEKRVKLPKDPRFS